MDKYCLFGRFQESVNAHPNTVACQTKEYDAYQTVTYARLYELSLKFAHFLRQEGLAKGERAGLLLENSHLWPAIYFGIMAAGSTAVPIDPKLTPYEVNNIIRDSGARILFSSAELYEPLEPRLKNILSFKCALLYPFKEIDTVEPKEISVENNPSDIASLLYTSGTTASPKGVMLTHKNFSSNFESIFRLKIILPRDNIIALLPLHHSYPFMVTLLTPLFTGSKITFLNSLKSEDLLKCLEETNATILVGVPQLYHLLHKAIFEKIPNPHFILPVLKAGNLARKISGFNLNKILLKKLHQKFGSSLRFFASGGARLDPKVGRGLTLLGFTILEGYGLTETSPVVTFNPLKRVRIGSVGPPIPEVKIKINNPNNENIGEVLIQGPNVMKGYYKKPKETLEVLKEGWFYSGDLGFIDKNGYLHLTGRSKEIIVLSSGKNIYPEEIENHYLKSPYIKEICVLETTSAGLSSLYAVVFPNVDYFRKTREINIQGKIRWILENLSKELPSYKRIMGFTIAKEELPKTRLGKLKRYEIKAGYLPLAGAGESETNQLKKEADSAKENIPQEPLSAEIIKFLSQQLKTKVNLNDHLELDLGIDSLIRVELAIALEKRFNINIPDADFSEIFTVQELIAKIGSLLNTGQEKLKPSIQPVWSQIIQKEPKQEILDKINLHPGITDKIISFLLLNLTLLVLKIFWRLEIKGRDNLPLDKPFILCPNHASYLDGFVAASSVGMRRELNLFFLGYSMYFQHPLVKWAVKIARLIAVDPALNLTEAMQASSYVLRNNKSLCVFPEGERSIDDQVKPFKKGAGILIKETSALVVPCYIRGSHHSWPRGKTFPRLHPIKIIFGKPCAREELKEAGEKKTDGDEYEAIAAGLKERVLELSALA
ncbi:MAG: AMP-binding protein [Candidatus Omnitrophota bacterium]